MSRKIMIVTGEASGDLHGANLVRALRELDHDLSFSGMGGPELEKNGVRILFPAEKVSVVGIFEVFSHLFDILQAQRILRRELRENPPDLLVLIDLPDFNLLLARVAKKLGIPVFYYIAPQVWAWRTGRVKQIAQRVDKLGVILPFEEQFFKERGVASEYVGHPLLDSVQTTSTREEFCETYKINRNSFLVGLLPGSRKREILSLLPDFLAAGRELYQNLDKPLVFLLPLAPTLSESDLQVAGLAEFAKDLDIRIIREQRYDMMSACDAVVAASGTVTLELAILQRFMVVTYRLSPLTYRIAKRLVKLPYFSLVNLIGGRDIVTELLQEEVTPARIAVELQKLLTDDAVRDAMTEGLGEVRERLGGPGASQKAAAVVYKMLG